MEPLINRFVRLILSAILMALGFDLSDVDDES